MTHLILAQFTPNIYIFGLINSNLDYLKVNEESKKICAS